MNSRKCKALLTPALLFSASSLLACGPWFPNNMLDRGDEAVLVAPVANFYQELDRMHFDAPRFHAVNVTNSFSAETVQTEIGDLRAALAKSGKSADETERIVASHLGERAKLQKFIDEFEQWTDSAPVEWTDTGERRYGKPATAQPVYPSLVAVEGLPDEFADYFEGAIFWHNPALDDKALARQAWERILNRPASERHYKSTWAAFMLGRYWETKDPKKANDYFKQVCELAAHDFSDPAGLAEASIGLEARLALRTNDFQTAIELYLEQYAADGWGSGESLQVALSRAVRAGPKALAPLALKPQTRRLVTAYLISQRMYDDSSRSQVNANVKAWLEAVEQADVKDVESAEQFALAAYQADEMQLAQRWIQRAGHSPTALWLEAKLLLRAGRVTEATELLAEIVPAFPVDQPAETGDTDINQTRSLVDELFVDDGANAEVFAGRYIRGELGALKLSRRDYTQALDLLVRADFWADASYIADHVLSTDELKGYVDENWPPIEPSADENKTEAQKKTEEITSSIRYLLARRLTRESRGMEARAYYPVQWLPVFDQFMEALNAGWNESIAAEERAKGLAAAAFIARTNGMELLGTESAPDWHMYGGDFEFGVTEDSRTNQEPTVMAASADELRRDAEHKSDPDKRFHYRYQAAVLAWEAAKLMPDNSDDTARLLCTAGSWLKIRDPQSADVFYKTLVRRCRKTPIGAKADAIRWFPELDDEGNLMRSRLELLDPPSSEVMNNQVELADYPTPGKHFIIQDGDHTRDIVAAVQRLGVPMTMKELFAANPELGPGDYSIGREIFIPMPETHSETPGEMAQPMTSEQTSAGEDPQSVQPPLTDAQPDGEYIIQSGDTLAKIAKQFGVTVRDLEEANPNFQPAQIKVGERIRIPTPPPQAM